MGGNINPENLSASSLQFRGQSPPRGRYSGVCADVCVVDNKDSAALPRKAIQVRYWSLFVTSRTIWALSLSDHASEGPDAGESDREKPKWCGVAYLMPGQAMQSDRLLSALSD